MFFLNTYATNISVSVSVLLSNISEQQKNTISQSADHSWLLNWLGVIWDFFFFWKNCEQVYVTRFHGMQNGKKERQASLSLVKFGDTWVDQTGFWTPVIPGN